MSSNLKLVFIPVWLERVLEASNERLTTALDPEKLSRILSTNDLQIYSDVQSCISSLLPYELVSSFSEHRDVNQGSNTLEDETKRGYLYGFLPDTHHLTVQPKFCAQHLGYDYVIVTVAKDQDLDGGAHTPINLMEEVIEILCSVQPLEDVAKLPIMSAWLKATAKNSVL